jgi:Programmed cell death protein 7
MSNKATNMYVDLSVPPPPLPLPLPVPALPQFDFSIPPPNRQQQTVEDQIATFLRGRENQPQPFIKQHRRRFVPKASLSRIKSDFLKSQALLEKLTNLQQQLEASSGAEWNRLVSEAENMKSQLETIESTYSQPDFKNELEKLYERRRKKRQRIKRRNVALRVQTAESQKASQTRIDKWQREIATQLQKEEAANAEAAHAKSVLADVTRKIGDAKKYLAEFQALIELRKARKIAVQASDLGERDFEAKIHELAQNWQDALVNYRLEEAELRRVLEARSSNASKIVEKRWCQALFGEQAATLHSHPLLKAEKDFAEFVVVRRAWDTCLVDNNDAEGSFHIPSGWVMPHTDPLPEWKVFRQQETKILY